MTPASNVLLHTCMWTAAGSALGPERHTETQSTFCMVLANTEFSRKATQIQTEGRLSFVLFRLYQEIFAVSENASLTATPGAKCLYL